MYVNFAAKICRSGGVSTGQKPQSPKKVIKSQVKIQQTTADKVESVSEDRLERPLKGFFKKDGLVAVELLAGMIGPGKGQCEQGE